MHYASSLWFPSFEAEQDGLWKDSGFQGFRVSGWRLQITIPAPVYIIGPRGGPKDGLQQVYGLTISLLSGEGGNCSGDEWEKGKDEIARGEMRDEIAISKGDSDRI